MRRGSCRDSAWLLVQIFRHLGLAARFASGYLIQLTADVKALDGPQRTGEGLHRPARMDRGLHSRRRLGGTGSDFRAVRGRRPHPACLHRGAVERGAGHRFYRRVPECSSVSAWRSAHPRRSARHQAVHRRSNGRTSTPSARKVDGQLAAWDVRLTMGGEPTFVSIDDMDGAEWNAAALGEEKRELAGELLAAPARSKFAPGGLLHYGQGKWYPGEPLPRWALSCFWRADGKPLWKDRSAARRRRERIYGFGPAQAQRFARALAAKTGPACRLRDSGLRRCLAGRAARAEAAGQRRSAESESRSIRSTASAWRGCSSSGLGEAGRLCAAAEAGAAAASAGGAGLAVEPMAAQARASCTCLRGDSPMGFRLPLDSLPWIAPAGHRTRACAAIRFEERADLHEPAGGVAVQGQEALHPRRLEVGKSAVEIIHTALCVQARAGRLHVFFPPLTAVEDWIDLVARGRSRRGRTEHASGAGGLYAAVRSAHPPLCGHARSRRDRSQHPSGVELGRIERQHQRTFTSRRA